MAPARRRDARFWILVTLPLWITAGFAFFAAGSFAPDAPLWLPLAHGAVIGTAVIPVARTWIGSIVGGSLSIAIASRLEWRAPLTDDLLITLLVAGPVLAAGALWPGGSRRQEVEEREGIRSVDDLGTDGS